jgi:hypothetical protein
MTGSAFYVPINNVGIATEVYAIAFHFQAKSARFWLRSPSAKPQEIVYLESQKFK